MPADYPAVVQQVVQSVRTGVVEGRGEMQLQLVPDQLGRIRMRVAVEDGRVTARIVTETQEARSLLEQIEGIKISELSRADECCGFGGTFAVSEEAVSCMMGKDRIADHGQAGTEVLTAVDMSCLMHMDGLIRRDGKPIRVKHIAEILAEVV